MGVLRGAFASGAASPDSSHWRRAVSGRGETGETELSSGGRSEECPGQKGGLEHSAEEVSDLKCGRLFHFIRGTWSVTLRIAHGCKHEQLWEIFLFDALLRHPGAPLFYKPVGRWWGNGREASSADTGPSTCSSDLIYGTFLFFLMADARARP